MRGRPPEQTFSLIYFAIIIIITIIVIVLTRNDFEIHETRNISDRNRRFGASCAIINFNQEPMSRSMQLHYVFIDRYIFRSNFPGIRLPWEYHNQSQETNWRHCVTGPETAFLSQKKKVFSTLANPIIHRLYPPKFCIMIEFDFSWDMKMTQEKSKTMPMQIFRG